MILPLFPLNTVLFPGCPLELQLFEPRYLDMLGRCLKQGSSFGVVSILEGQEVGLPASKLADIGCEALIRDWQQLPNGLLGIRVEGGRRFKSISSWAAADQLTCAEVSWLEPANEQPLLDQHADLVALLQALARHPLTESLGICGSATGQLELANQLAYLLPVRLEEKLELLRIDCPLQQLEQIQIFLGRLQGATSA